MYKQLLYSFLSFVLLMSCTSSSQREKGPVNEGDTLLVRGAVDIESDRGYIVRVGDMAPDFDMVLPDGASVTLSSLRGKVVMLQFTASWCGVCRKEMPHIESDIWQRHKDNPEFLFTGLTVKNLLRR